MLFREIRAGDVAAVANRLDRDPALVHAIAKSPPKKDDGQSTLQVAIKSANIDVAYLLLDRGADVRFMDSSDINGWNMPVLHDAIRAAVFSSRFGRNRARPGEPPRIELLSTAERFEAALGLLKRVLQLGADPNELDSYGNSPLMRAVLDVRQVLRPPVPDELESDLLRVFGALRDAGTDFDWVDARSGRRPRDQFDDEPVARFLSG